MNRRSFFKFFAAALPAIPLLKAVSARAEQVLPAVKSAKPMKAVHVILSPYAAERTGLPTEFLLIDVHYTPIPQTDVHTATFKAGDKITMKPSLPLHLIFESLYIKDLYTGSVLKYRFGQTNKFQARNIRSLPMLSCFDERIDSLVACAPVSMRW